jgi:hypothetical protein
MAVICKHALILNFTLADESLLFVLPNGKAQDCGVTAIRSFGASLAPKASPSGQADFTPLNPKRPTLSSFLEREAEEIRGSGACQEADGEEDT